MGTYLSTPVTDKCSESGHAMQTSGATTKTAPKVNVAWGVVDMQGWRKSMEDAHIATSLDADDYTSGGTDNATTNTPSVKLFGVFDGHGGPEVARFCQLYMVSVLTQQPAWRQLMEQQQQQAQQENATRTSPTESLVGQALQATFHALDRLIDHPTKRDELLRLRAVKPAPGERRHADYIPPPHVNWSVAHLKEQQQTYRQRSMFSQYILEQIDADNNNDNDESEEVPFDELADRSMDTHHDDNTNHNENTNANDMANPNEDNQCSDSEMTQQQQQEKHDDTDNIDDKEDAFVAEKKDDDSDAVVGKEEAAQLDQDMMMTNNTHDDNDNNDDDDDENDDMGDQIMKDAKQFLDETDGDADTEDEGTGSSGTAGKVSGMFQRLLQMSTPAGASCSPPASAAFDFDNSDNLNNYNSNDFVHIPEAALDATPDQDGPPTANVTTAPASLLQNGRRVCNLPDHPVHAGATAVVAVLVDTQLTVANAGDSRAVLARSGVAFPLSFDHKPSHEEELRRIQKAGGFVNHFGRVNGNLNLSRSLGDLKYKQVAGVPPAAQMITAHPDLIQVDLDLTQDDFVILGCDGIWDCLSNQQAVDYVKHRIATKTPAEIGVEMLDEILSVDPRSTQGIGGDNMTIMVIDLQPHTRPYYNHENEVPHPPDAAQQETPPQEAPSVVL